MEKVCQRCRKPIKTSTNMMRFISAPPAGGYMTHIACPNEGETDEEAITRWNASIPSMTARPDSGAMEQAEKQVVQRAGRDIAAEDDRSPL